MSSSLSFVVYGSDQFIPAPPDGPTTSDINVENEFIVAFFSDYYGNGVY